MSQHPIEVILAQRLASYLAMPAFLVGADGNLLYYNEGAERIIGYRFDETGTVPMERWASMLKPCDSDGNPLPDTEMPVVKALSENRPVHNTLRLTGLDGVTRVVTGTSLPLASQGDRHLGVLTVFWEEPR